MVILKVGEQVNLSGFDVIVVPKTESEENENLLEQDQYKKTNKNKSKVRKRGIKEKQVEIYKPSKIKHVIKDVLYDENLHNNDIEIIYDQDPLSNNENFINNDIELVCSNIDPLSISDDEDRAAEEENNKIVIDWKDIMNNCEKICDTAVIEISNTNNNTQNENDDVVNYITLKILPEITNGDDYENNTLMLLERDNEEIKIADSTSSANNADSLKNGDENISIKTNKKKCKKETSLNKNLNTELVYLCSICNKEFENKTDLRVHNNSVHAGRASGLLCHKKTNMKKSLTSAKRIQINVTNNVPQKKVIADTKSLNEQKIYPSPYNRKTLFCDICKTHFFSEYRLILHKSSSHLIDISCPCCYKKDFISKEIFHKHLRACKKRHKIKSCPICFVEIPGCDMKKHKQIHSLNTEYLCTFCGKKFARKYSLIIHEKGIHQVGNTEFLCDQCPVKVNTLNKLKSHIRVVHSKLSFQCNICDRTFKTKANLRSHMKYVHLKLKKFPHFPKELCKICGRFVRLNKRHLATHCLIECEVCGQEFGQYCLYQEHVKIHMSQDKVRTCNICNKIYTNKGYGVHMKKFHSSVTNLNQTYKYCNFCYRKFTTKNSLSRHVTLIHLSSHQNNILS